MNTQNSAKGHQYTREFRFPEGRKKKRKTSTQVYRARRLKPRVNTNARGWGQSSMGRFASVWSPCAAPEGEGKVDAKSATGSKDRCLSHDLSPRTNKAPVVPHSLRAEKQSLVFETLQPPAELPELGTLPPGGPLRHWTLQPGPCSFFANLRGALHSPGSLRSSPAQGRQRDPADMVWRPNTVA